MVGYLVEKLGPRRAVLSGLVALGGGFLLFSRVENLWMFYLAFVIMGISAELGTWFPIMTAINNWFQKRRATAFGWSMEGMALGGVILIPAMAWAIDPDRFGADQWRQVAAGMGVVILLLSLPLSRMVRNRPEDYGQSPDGDSATITPPVADRPPSLQARGEETGFSWQEAVRTRTLWLMTFGNSCSAALSVTMAVHLGPMLDDREISLTTVGFVLALQTGMMAVLIPIGGYIGDKFQIRKAIFVFQLVQSVGVIILLHAHNPAFAFVYAAIMGIGQGGRISLTISMPGTYFGRKNFPMIMGISFMVVSVFMFAAPLFAGYIFDATSSYEVPFTTLAVLNTTGSLAYLLMGPPKPPPLSQRRAKARLG